MTSYFRGTVDCFSGGNLVRPYIGQNLIDFYFFKNENGLFMEEGWQVGNAPIDHIDFALIFLFVHYLSK